MNRRKSGFLAFLLGIAFIAWFLWSVSSFFTMLWLAGMLLLLGFPGLMLVIIGLCGLFGQIFRPLERIYPMLLRIFGIYVACYGVFLFAMMIWGLLTETEDRLGFTILVPICAGIVLVGRTIYHKGKELAEQERRNEFFRSKASK